MLTAVGVGAGAIPTAAAISWVLKDGLGCLGMILVAGRLGSYFDIETKRMRWVSDFLHLAGVAVIYIYCLSYLYIYIFLIIQQA